LAPSFQTLQFNQQGRGNVLAELLTSWKTVSHWNKQRKDKIINALHCPILNPELDVSKNNKLILVMIETHPL
jgi:hypothetical protein